MIQQKKRGARTPGHIAGPWIESDWHLSNGQWLTIAGSYCPRFKVGILASIAADASQAHQKAAGLSEKAAALEKARRTTSAYTDAAKDIATTNDMSENARHAERWKAGITTATRDYIARVRIEQSGAPVPATQAWMAKLEQAARAFVKAYDAPLAPHAKSLARADVEALMREGSNRIERQLPQDLDILGDITDEEKAALLEDEPKTGKERKEPPDHETALAGPTIHLREIVSCMRKIALYTPIAGAALDDEEHFVDGSAWRRWIVDLTNVCNDASLPTKISHKILASGGTSEFVAFVIALMKTLPKSLQRKKAKKQRAKQKNDGDEESLAKAIRRARDDAKTRGAKPEHGSD